MLVYLFWHCPRPEIGATAYLRFGVLKGYAKKHGIRDMQYYRTTPDPLMKPAELAITWSLPLGFGSGSSAGGGRDATRST